MERKKQKGIDPNHWMCRIQKTVFGIDATQTYMGYCPFFWMTWLAIILYLPSVVIQKILIPLGGLIGKVTSPAINTCIENVNTIKLNRTDRIRNTPLVPNSFILTGLYHAAKKVWFDDGTIYRTNFQASLEKPEPNVDEIAEGIWSDVHQIHDRVVARRIALWLVANPNWKELYLEQKNRDDEAAKKSAERKQAVCSAISKVSFIGPIIFKILVPAVIAFAIYLCGCLLFKLGCFVVTIPATSWIVGASTILLLVGACAGVMIVGDFIKTFIFPNFGGWVGSFFKTLFTPFTFLYETIHMSYKQECPLIVWGETTPITKIDKAL